MKKTDASSLKEKSKRLLPTTTKLKSYDSTTIAKCAPCGTRKLRGALTDRIADREIFMKGIDYSYYYEQEE